jgi:hypothetical protein
LKQIIINLLSNAIKYNKEEGTVVVDCTASTAERIRISFKDTGAGLPPEKLAQLFQPFNRLGQEAGGVAGTGIGLIVTKRLAEMMGGILGVESTPGAGSVFWCELTLTAAPQLKIPSGEAQAFVRPQLPAGAPLRTLLYVEDNPANMELVEQLIARCPDIRMMTAVTGTLGIEGDPHGHQSARHQRRQSLEDPERRPGHGPHPRRGPERQCHAPRHREWLGSGILQLSHQTN